jgi:DNA-binding NtrC family response regulator
VEDKNKPTILIIEDDEIQLSLIKKVLQRDFNVKTTFNTKTLPMIIDKFEINLIVFDLHLQNSNSCEAVKSLKSKLEEKNIPFIFMSEDKDEETINNCLSLGARTFLPKPFRPNTLKDTIQDNINK